jgi:hypothetical protein
MRILISFLVPLVLLGTTLGVAWRRRVLSKRCSR